MPKFSIVIPAFNAADTLLATIDSIRAQTCTDWELIIVDDQSTDATFQIGWQAEKDDSRITICCSNGKGPSDARNYGALVLATGKYIAFCDADDLWLPEKLARVERLFADKHLDAVFGQIGFFQETPDKLQTVSTVPTQEVTVQMLLGENPVCTTSNLTVQRKTFEQLGGFNANMVHSEDLELLIRLVAEGCKLQGDQGRHVLYRTSTGGLSSDLEAMQSGRARALTTAARYGYAPDPASEAVHLRYLARRALRLNVDPKVPWRLARRGLSEDARAFLFPPRRGVATALGALLAPVLPAALRRGLFAK